MEVNVGFVIVNHPVRECVHVCEPIPRLFNSIYRQKFPSVFQMLPVTHLKDSATTLNYFQYIL